MKKLIPILLAVCMLTALMAATVSADDHTDPIQSFITEETTNPDVVFPAGSVPAEAGLTEGIHLPVHALALSMWEHDLSYDIGSAPFVWNALYYTLSLCGEMDDRAQRTDDALLLPSEAINDFARALFAGLEQLPDLPAELDGFISYDAAADTYHLWLGDFALTRTVLEGLTRRPDGTFAAQGTLLALEDDSPLCSFRITLLENDTMFGFSILDVVF